MPGLVPGIHVFHLASKSWMARTSPAMTRRARGSSLVKAEEPARIEIKHLLLVLFGQPDFIQHLQRLFGRPAGIVVAEHNVIDAKEIDRKLYAGSVRRDGVGIEGLEIDARVLRQVRRAAALVHAPGLIRQGSARVRHEHLQLRMTLEDA